MNDNQRELASEVVELLIPEEMRPDPQTVAVVELFNAVLGGGWTPNETQLELLEESQPLIHGLLAETISERDYTSLTRFHATFMPQATVEDAVNQCRNALNSHRYPVEGEPFDDELVEHKGP